MAARSLTNCGSSGNRSYSPCPHHSTEEARELTVLAAREAGLENLTLLEEPLAAFYSWIAAHQGALKRKLKAGS
jgi:molecular chaperone DnaK (HSP70)